MPGPPVAALSICWLLFPSTMGLAGNNPWGHLARMRMLRKRVSVWLQLVSSVLTRKVKVTAACRGGSWYLSTICRARTRRGKDRQGMISYREKRLPHLSPVLIPQPHLSKYTAAAMDLHQELPWDLCQCCLLQQQPLLAGDLESPHKAPLRLHPHKSLA